MVTLKSYFILFHLGRVEAIEALIKYGADVNARNGNDNTTALIIAAEKGLMKQEILKLIKKIFFINIEHNIELNGFGRVKCINRSSSNSFTGFCQS